MFRKIRRNWLSVWFLIVLVLAIFSIVADIVTPVVCPKCESVNIEKMYERKEYRSWVYGYDCHECGYQFER